MYLQILSSDAGKCTRGPGNRQTNETRCNLGFVTCVVQINADDCGLYNVRWEKCELWVWRQQHRVK